MEIKNNDEFKTGIFVFLGLFIIIGSLSFLGSDFFSFHSKFNYTAKFKRIDGLINGAKVMAAGLTVGTVQHIHFDKKEHNIVVGFSVFEEALPLITQSSLAEIMTQGMLGDKYLNITEGNAVDSPLPPESVIKTDLSDNQQTIFEKGQNLISSLEKIAQKIDLMMYTLNKNDRTEKVFNNIEGISKNILTLSQNLSSKIQDIDIKNTLNTLNSILEKINTGSGTLSLILNDPLLYDQFKDVIGGINRNRIMRNIIRDSIKTPSSKESKE